MAIYTAPLTTQAWATLQRFAMTLNLKRIIINQNLECKGERSRPEVGGGG